MRPEETSLSQAAQVVGMRDGPLATLHGWEEANCNKSNREKGGLTNKRGEPHEEERQEGQPYQGKRRRWRPAVVPRLHSSEIGEDPLAQIKLRCSLRY